jgi:hypothetical protein
VFRYPAAIADYSISQPRRPGRRRRRSRAFIAFLAVATIMVGLSGAAEARVPDDAVVVAPQPEDVLDRFTEVIRCVTLSDEAFCTELGFTTDRPGSKSWEKQLRAAIEADVSGSGDLSYKGLLAYLESLSPQELEARQKEQIDNARGAVGRVKLVDHLADNQVIPDGFFKQYPELGIEEDGPVAVGLRAAAADRSGTTTLEHVAAAGGLPEGVVLDPEGEEGMAAGSSAPAGKQASGSSTASASAASAPTYRYIIYDYYVQQSTNYYCGPATMDAIDWADDGFQNGQSFWAGSSFLRTDQQGATALSDLVLITNNNTGWDSSSHGGSYSMVSVSGKSLAWFVDQHELRIGVYGAPIIEHVKLRNEYYTYLRYDHGGHFQTGRGYSNNSSTIAIFEPYDERDWSSGGYYTGKRQYVPYQNIYDATQVHPHKNMGA